jgi:hypothetical protein
MNTYIILGFLGLTSLLLLVTFLFIQKVKELKMNYSNLEEELTEKVNNLFSNKEQDLNRKIDTIQSWQKYIDINIGDPVYFEMSLTQGKGSKGELSFKVFVEAEVLDISKTKAKIKVIDVSINNSSNKIVKQEVIDYINDHNCWQELFELEKRISIEDRRDMQLNKILK